MHAFLATLALAAFQSPPAPDSKTPDHDSKQAAPKLVAPSRADLARSYLRFERALALHPQAGEPLRALNQAFDRATLSFFMGNGAAALEAIDGAAFELTKGEPPGADRTMMSLVARFDPPTASVAKPLGSPLRVRIEPLYLVTGDAARPRTLHVEFVSPFEGGIALAKHDFTDWRPDAPPVELRVAIDPVPAKSYTVIAELAGEAKPTRIGEWDTTAEELDTVRAANGKRAAKIVIDGPPMEAAIAAFRSRNGMLARWNAPDRTAFLGDAPRDLVFRLAQELEALEAGRDPYRRASTDVWRTFRVGGKDVPLRVFAPYAACQDERVPLVIALHGAGGDENMFFDGYGAGKIVDLAREKGFVVAAPLVSFAGLSSAAFDALVTELVYDYAIDPARVYVIGHSMGAGAAAGLAAARRDRIAAVACLAGGSAPADRAMAPTHVWVGELDPLARPEPLKKLCDAAHAGGAPIECEIVPDQGHTLLVGAVLPRAVEWLLSHRLEPSAPKK